MAINTNCQIRDISITQSGDIWIDVNRCIFEDIKYNNEWQQVVIQLTKENLYKLCPQTWNYLSGKNDDPDFTQGILNEQMAEELDELEDVIIRFEDTSTIPLPTINQVHLYVTGWEIDYDGETEEREDEETGWEIVNCIEIGDEGWEDYYRLKLLTSPHRSNDW